MKLLTNFPVFNGCLEGYGSMAAVVDDCARLGLDGLEVIWDFDPYVGEMPPRELVVGYHLVFFASWVDFWKGDEAGVLAEFGSWEAARESFGCETPDELVGRYRVDLQRAVDLGAEYVVFHVSDVGLAECFTYDFKHDDREVCDCSAELANRILDGFDADVAFLVENQWWPGLTFTDPAMTRRLLDAIAWENKGVMLDTGHLMNANTKLRSQAEAARFVREMFDAHGDVRDAVRGMHLHQSLSGEFVERAGGRLPDDFTGDYWQRFARCYDHVLKIDRHEPWTDPAVAELVAHIGPEWVNNELSAWPRAAHNRAVETQLAALRG